VARCCIFSLKYIIFAYLHLLNVFIGGIIVLSLHYDMPCLFAVE